METFSAIPKPQTEFYGVQTGGPLNRDQSVQHSERVVAWIEKSVRGLPYAEQVQIFADAVGSLENRIIITLSTVTWNAILDRGLSQSIQNFPILSEIKIQPGGISIDRLLQSLQKQSADQMIEAFKFFLIELLTIVGNLTAGVLTESLYRELSKVVAKSNSRVDREDI